MNLKVFVLSLSSFSAAAQPAMAGGSSKMLQEQVKLLEIIEVLTVSDVVHCHLIMHGNGKASGLLGKGAACRWWDCFREEQMRGCGTQDPRARLAFVALGKFFIDPGFCFINWSC